MTCGARSTASPRASAASAPIDAFYPFVGVRVEAGELNLDGRLAYGALHDPGIYGTTLTRPRLFGDYYRTQLGILLKNHGVPVVTGVSTRPIPLPFVLEEMAAEIRQSGCRRCSTCSRCPTSA